MGEMGRMYVVTQFIAFGGDGGMGRIGEIGKKGRWVRCLNEGDFKVPLPSWERDLW